PQGSDGLGTNRPNAATALAVREAQHLAHQIDLGPPQPLNLAATAAGERDHPDDLHRLPWLACSVGLIQQSAHGPIGELVTPHASHPVCRPNNAPHGVAVSIALAHRVAEDATEEPERASSGPAAAGDDSPTPLLGFYVGGALAGDDIAKERPNVCSREV